ncbi:MAG: chorismate mutase [Candidatus Tokpelaia sp. JSC085]|nr:MAG: chorismate mutase [Candidatus Tokpelaia sp. JSC085]
MKEERTPRQLLALRASIDNFDAALVHILAERFRCTESVGILKAQHGLPPIDHQREKNQIERLRSLAKEAQVDPDFVEGFFKFIVREVVHHHEDTAALELGGQGKGIRKK